MRPTHAFANLHRLIEIACRSPLAPAISSAFANLHRLIEFACRSPLAPASRTSSSLARTAGRTPHRQNECYSNIANPGSTSPTGKFGPCPLLNGSSGKVWRQSNGTFPADPNAVDMLEVDDLYDEALADFVRGAVAEKAAHPFLFYFASHHTHAPQFAGKALTATTRRGLFGDSLASLDRSVGRLLSLLAELRIANNTLVILSADNGGSLQWRDLGGVNGDFRCGKGTTFEGGHRVPSSVWWPGVVARGLVVEGMVSSLDWFPTLTALAGSDTDPADADSGPATASDTKVSDGFDLTSYLFEGGAARGDKSPRQEFFYYDTSGIRAPASTAGNAPLLMAARVGSYKAHWYTRGSHCNDDYPDAACYAPVRNHTGSASGSDGPLLFNVDTDPGEISPISATLKAAEYKQAMAAIEGAVQKHLRTWDVAPSEMAKGSSPDRFPCCNPGCSPAPHCCRCPTMS